jgi:hypothetical protein
VGLHPDLPGCGSQFPGVRPPKILDTRPVNAIAFHHDILGEDNPKRFFNGPA